MGNGEGIPFISLLGGLGSVVSTPSGSGAEPKTILADFYYHRTLLAELKASSSSARGLSAGGGASAPSWIRHWKETAMQYSVPEQSLKIFFK